MTENFIDIEHQFLEYAGSKIHFVTCGAPGNLPLFLLHSFYMSWAIFKPHLRYLSRHFYIVAPDFPGFGRSRELLSKNNTQNFVRVLEDIRGHLKLGKINLFGFSAGGIVALKYASQYSQNVLKLSEQGAPYYFGEHRVLWKDRMLLRALVYPAFGRLAKWLTGQKMFWPFYRRLSRGLDRLMTFFPPGQVEKDVRDLSIKAVCEWGFDILRLDLRRELSKITCPVLVISGRRDPYLSINSVSKMVKFFESPPRLSIVDDGDHEITIKKPALVARSILDFCL